MARLRLPKPLSSLETAVQPLECGNASYDALAPNIEHVEGMLAPNIAMLRMVPRGVTIRIGASEGLETSWPVPNTSNAPLG